MAYFILSIQLLSLIFFVRELFKPRESRSKVRLSVFLSMSVLLVLALYLYFQPFTISLPDAYSILLSNENHKETQITNTEEIHNILSKLEYRRPWGSGNELIKPYNASGAFRLYILDENDLTYADFLFPPASPDRSICTLYQEDQIYQILNAESIMDELNQFLNP